MRLFSSTGVGQLAVRFCRSLAQITCTLALLLALFTLFAPAAVLAQEKTSDAPLTVGLYVSPPFVMEENGSYTGMAIDIWENLSRKLDLDFEYRNFENFGDLLDETAAGTVDVAVTNVTITRARAERVDFTQPWFDSGLRIMVNEDRGVGFRALVCGPMAGWLWSLSGQPCCSPCLTVGSTNNSPPPGVTVLRKASTW